jgi:hypothetical protein
MSKDERGWNSSLSEKPVRSRPRRLVDWINLTGAKKVHSLIDKVYKRKNLHLVASLQALAQCRLETAGYGPALRRVRACSSDRLNSFSGLSALLSLRESCLPEMGTGSLGGGRRPARERASSDPRMVRSGLLG